MVDPRIYRALLVLVAFAVIVFGFSLQSQPGGVSTTLAPGQFFGSAYASVNALASAYPNRTPGSASDNGLAEYVKNELIAVKGFQVSTQAFTARTAAGQQVLTNVLATRAGTGSGEIVVVAHRDSRPHAGQARADISGTVVLLDLARALAGETLNRSVLLVSTSGEVGAAGATELAHSLTGQPVDAVIALGDLAGARRRSPVVVGWSGSDLLAPPMLANTLSAYVRQAAGIATPETGLAGQLVRLAFPFAVTEQSPFIESGLPAVLLSVDGDTLTPAHALVSATTAPRQLASLGSAVLQTVNALDQGAAVPAPSSYLVIDGKLVPLWALRLLVLALIVPVLATTVDALARTRRRGHSILRWLGWVLCGSLPFLVAIVALLLARLTGLLSAAPPGAVGAGGVPISGGDVAVLVGVLVLMALAFLVLRPLALRAVASLYGQSPAAGRPPGAPESPAADAAAVALTLVLCVVALALWLLNPFAALFLVPALHLWLWLAQPGVRSHRWAVMAFSLLAALPAVPVLIYYANAYGLTPLGLIWSGALMIAGGAMPLAPAACWALALGCLASALVIAARSVRSAAAQAQAPVTVRGPATYAGPGSLGGTNSALRR